MPPNLIPTRLLLLSDTHNALPLPHPHPLPRADLLIHSGDLTLTGDLVSLSSQLQYLADADAGVKVLVWGNHDVSIDRGFYEGNWERFHGGGGGEVDAEAIRDLLSNPQWQTKNLHILDEGIHTIDLPNGARVTLYASPYTPEFQGWAFAYERCVDRFNPPARGDHDGGVEHPVPDWPGVDLMVTHGPPRGVLDQVVGAGNVGCEYLGRAVRRCRPRMHVFGHIHEGWGGRRVEWGGGGGGKDLMRMEGEEAEGDGGEGFVRLDLRGDGRDGGVRWGEETVFVNASVMDVEYKPVQKMWLVDIDLPVRQDRDEGEKGVKRR